MKPITIEGVWYKQPSYVLTFWLLDIIYTTREAQQQTNHFFLLVTWSLYQGQKACVSFVFDFSLQNPTNLCMFVFLEVGFL